LENQGNHKGLPLQSARRGNPLWLPLLMLAKWYQDWSDPALVLETTCKISDLVCIMRSPKLADIG